MKHFSALKDFLPFSKNHTPAGNEQNDSNVINADKFARKQIWIHVKRDSIITANMDEMQTLQVNTVSWLLTCFPSVIQNRQQHSHQQTDEDCESLGDLQALPLHGRFCARRYWKMTTAAISGLYRVLHIRGYETVPLVFTSWKRFSAITHLWETGWGRVCCSPDWLDSPAHSWTHQYLNCSPARNVK